MPEGCEGGGEAQGGGYGGSASCGSAPRCRTLFQARLRECKFCIQRGCGLQRSQRSGGENTKCCSQLHEITGQLPREILTPKFLDQRETQTDAPWMWGENGRRRSMPVFTVLADA